MKDFLFKPEQARTPVRELSGGERARLILARVLARPANLLVLDEPTNDLDMETLDLLQELVAGFAGTVILVSHDRDFLDRTVTSVLAPDGGGRWIEYAGGYSDMLAQRGGTSSTSARCGRGRRRRRLAHAAAKPTRRNLRERQPRSSPTSRNSRWNRCRRRWRRRTASIARLEASLADPKLFSSDPAAFGRTAAALEAERAALAIAGGRMAGTGDAARGDRGLSGLQPR